MAALGVIAPLNHTEQSLRLATPGEKTVALRADAARNRARLLDVAEQLLIDKGTAVSTDEIAKAAGVGIGTLFRHFPSKEALLEGVYHARMHRLTDEARRLSETTTGDGLESFMRQAVEQASLKNALAGLLTTAGIDLTTALNDDLRASLGALLEAAQRSGAARTDLQPGDLIGLLAGAAKAIEFAGDDPVARTRILDVILTGLRP